MTADEWDEVTVAMLAYWPNREIPNESFDIWFSDLGEFEAEHVEAAVKALARDGREWMPNGGQIRNKILELRTPTMDYSAAYKLAMEAAGPRGGFMGGLKWLREQSPLAAETVERYGWRDFCYEDAPDTTRRAQFRDMFLQVAEISSKRERYAGIEAPGLEGLPSGPKRIGDVIKLMPGSDAA